MMKSVPGTAAGGRYAFETAWKIPASSSALSNDIDACHRFHLEPLCIEICATENEPTDLPQASDAMLLIPGFDLPNNAISVEPTISMKK